MAKRRAPKKSSLPQAEGSEFPSAFAGLAALRDSLPQADLPVVPAERSETAEQRALPAKVVVRRERKGRKGKTVTRVSGFGAESESWALRIKQELGCGGSVQADEIILSGDLGDRVARWLQAAGIDKISRGS